MFGTPAAQGSKRFLGRQGGTGKGIMIETSAKVKPWREDVKAAAEAELERIGRPAPLDCALSVDMVFTFLRPKSVNRLKRPHVSVFPDLSKMIRSTEDALTQAGVWRDDALVVSCRASKVYALEGHPYALDRPGAVIVVEPLLPWSMKGGTPPLEIDWKLDD